MRPRLASLVCLIALAPALLGGCTWLKRRAYEGGSRDEWQQPERVIEALALAPGARVADLGSGSGYFSRRLARTVGPQGRVYAVDVDPDMNAYLRQRVADEGLANVEVILGRFDDPLLPDGAVDLVLVVDTYHHLEDRTAYFRRLRADLAPGGRIAVIDYDERGGWFVRWFDHHTDKAVLVREMAEAGYAVEADHAFLDRQLFVVFRPED
jgi:ubiquinone/menaquinone biosynthesis C-methylase UbiE